MRSKINLSIFKVSFLSFCLVATLVSITQVSAEGNNTVSANSSATTSVTVSSACSFERTGTGSGEYSGTLSNGHDNEIIGSTFKTICNDPGGYDIYAVGYSNNTFGNTDLIYNNIVDSVNNIKTDGANGNSYWRMKAEGVTTTGTPPSIVNNFDDYHVIPSTYTKIASLSTVTDSTSTSDQSNIQGSSIAISYQAFASNTQPAGTYTGAVKYTIVHPSINTTVDGNPYFINFNPNGGTGNMEDQKMLVGVATTLNPNAFTAPENKGFGGWCTTSTADCTDGTLYTNEQAVTNLATAGGEITLYAMWGKTITTMTYLQDFTNPVDKNSIIGSMAPETTYTKKDKRDEQDYTIAILKDGKVWMTKNLNLAGGTEITSELSDVPENYTLPTENGFQEGNKLPESSQTGFSDYTQTYVYNTGNDTDNCGAGCYSYYSWTAATIGSLKSIVTGDSDAPASICPAGWKMPNSRQPNSPVYQSTDFYQLAIAYGATENQNVTNTSTFYNETGIGTIPNFLLAGHYDNSRCWDGNNSGQYWSSTSDSTRYSFYFNFFRASIHIWAYYPRERGMPVRCLAR